MEKLELKDFAPYLPYRPKFQAEVGLVKLEGYIESIDFSDNSVQLEPCAVHRFIYLIKPLLHPLSELTKEIEHNGEKFVPSEILSAMIECAADEDWIDHCIDLSWKDMDLDAAPYWFVKKLLKWHFDIGGLIDKGLAIDLNTIEK